MARGRVRANKEGCNVSFMRPHSVGDCLRTLRRCVHINKSIYIFMYYCKATDVTLQGCCLFSCLVINPNRFPKHPGFSRGSHRTHTGHGEDGPNISVTSRCWLRRRPGLGPRAEVLRRHLAEPHGLPRRCLVSGAAILFGGFSFIADSSWKGSEI